MYYYSGYYLADASTGEVVGACQSDVSIGFSGTWAYTNDGSSWSIMTTTVSESLSTVGAIAIVGWNVIQTSIPSTSTTSTTIDSSSILKVSTTNTLLNLPIATAASSDSVSYTSSVISRQSTLTASQPALSTGASVGIGLGVAFGFIGAVSLLVSLYLTRRRRHREHGQINGNGLSEPKGLTVEPRIQSLDRDLKKDKTWAFSQELDNTRQISELHSVPVHEFPAELSG